MSTKQDRGLNVMLTDNDRSSLVPSVWGIAKAILRISCFHVSSLSHEEKCRLSQLQNCLPKTIPCDDVLSKQDWLLLE